MAIYSFNISNVSRAKGSASTATLSYISAEKVKDERLNKSFNFGRSERVVSIETILPEYAPSEFKDPSVLFNSIERYEKSDNARPAKKIMVALPREFDLNLQQKVLQSYIQENITCEGYACTYAIHTDAENNNPHAHILIANRSMDKKGKWKIKYKKEYALDENGERIPLLDEQGNQKLGKRNEKLWKRVNVEYNYLDRKETLERLREQWSVQCNRYLEPENKIDHRSNEDRGIDYEPTLHEGFRYPEPIREINKEIKKRNALLSELREELKKIIQYINELIQKRGEMLNERINKLMQRRTTSQSSRTATDGERTVDSREPEAEVSDINAFIADLDAQRETAERNRQYSEAQRKARDDERKRSDRARKQEIKNDQQISRNREKEYDREL